MAHEAQRVYFNKVKNKYPDFFSDVKVLEIGSLYINGTVRDFFNAKEYIGIDVGMGPGVDIVAQGQEFDYPDEYFDTTISAECFEHNPFWLETFLNMIRMTKNGGLVTFSCASLGREEHGTTRSKPQDSPLTLDLKWDYYCNLYETDFLDVMNMNDYFEKFEFEYNAIDFDLYFYGIKNA
jgi:SAM-dependent methyltransferase